MDGEEILNKNSDQSLGLNIFDQLPIIDIGQNQVAAQWIESFLKTLDEDLTKGYSAID
ncbi:MAG: hypothetical protein ABI761_09450 [Saprospiraceae bacterium]